MYTASQRHRAHDPITSVQAAQKAEHFAGSHIERIYRSLTELGPQTAKELQQTTGLAVVQIDRRLPEMKKLGMAEVAQHDGKDLIRSGYRVWSVI